MALRYAVEARRIASFSSRGMSTWEIPFGYGRAKVMRSTAAAAVQHRCPPKPQLPHPSNLLMLCLTPSVPAPRSRTSWRTDAT